MRVSPKINLASSGDKCHVANSDFVPQYLTYEQDAGRQEEELGSS